MDGNKKIRGIVIVSAVALALFSCRVHIPTYIGLYVDNSIPYSDSATYTGEVSLDLVNTATFIETGPKSDLHPAKEMIMVSSDNVYQHEIKELLKGIADSVQLIRCQVFELQKQFAGLPVTSIAGEKLQQFRQAEGLQKEPDFKQLLHVKNDSISMLRNQVNKLQKYTDLKADTVYVIRETAGSPVVENQQNDQLILQLLRSKDEQINNLQNQLDQRQDLQLLPQKRDTVYIEKEVKELQSVKEIAGQQKETGLQSLHDTIRLLKSRVLSLEEQIMSGRDTTITARQDEKDELLTVITDTILYVAYYLRGEIKPIEEEKILQQIKELYRDTVVAKVTLSGYTDSSGDEIINKEITNRRLNYLSEMIVPWIAKEKIFFQNFGDVFASDTVIEDERRVEIRIYTKYDNSFIKTDSEKP